MKIKSAIAALVTLSGTLSLTSMLQPTTALAANAQHKMQKSEIVLNGKVFSTEYTFVGGSPATTYMPIYYVQQLINKMLGTDSSSDVWNGINHTWTITTDSSASTDNVDTGIIVNGKAFEKAPILVDVNPSSGQPTTFMPIWYVQQLLNQLLNLSTGTDKWNGGATIPTWTISTSATGSQLTQSQMASAIWNVLNSASWDVNSHPSESDAGVTPSSTVPVTAGDVATWLADWASKSKGYDAHPYNDDSDVSYQPWSLKYEASQDAYTWAKINGLYQGTSVTSASSIISSGDKNALINNLKWWVNGYKSVSGGWTQLHLPFYSHYETWQLVSSGSFTQAQYDQMMTDDTTYFDQVEVKPSGSNFLVKLPDSSSRKIVWQVVDGSYTWGYSHGTSGTGFFGGNTLTVPNKGPGLTIFSASLNYQAQGSLIAYISKNGSLDLSNPYDVTDLQTPN
ncbi:hypothetical protein ACOALA_20655 (plasmid) [Alicyclobacillus acidoterrestris]|uniref:hypothetical protein n=1 Tax=Alicyclobacillus acidoterrestris TaxID=1450 RepID=UPI003F531FE4